MIFRNQNIIFTGLLTGTPLKEIFSHAGMFVLPSSHEGLPLALLEAMSYGLPCIASDIPANRAVRLGAERYFEPGDIAVLAEKIRANMETPMSGPEKEDQVGRIRKEFNWTNIADQTLAIYADVLKNGKNGTG